MLLAIGCAVPEHMEVRAGKDPRNADDDVRFRTTYYFRVFDACRAIDDANSQVREEDIVPETDSLYRYRMTGKAFSLFTNVHFEAGILKSYEIDPFGANIVFDQENNRFHFKSRSQTEAEAAREDDYRELQRLINLYSSLNESETVSETVLARINALIELKLDEMAGRKINGGVRPVGVSSGNKIADFKELADRFANLRASIVDGMDEAEKAGIERQMEDLRRAMQLTLRHMEAAMAWEVAVTRSEQGDTQARAEWAEHIRSVEGLKTLDAVKDNNEVQNLVTASIDKLKIAKAVDVRTVAGARDDAPNYTEVSAPSNLQLCPPGKILRRGFQILGPEGWRTFNQDDRLLLAMSSSGKPLISTLKNISDRVLNEQDSQSAVLLPLVEERLTISRTRRTLDKLESNPPPKDAPTSELQAMVEKVIEAFGVQTMAKE